LCRSDKNRGSLYFSYKEFYSIAVLAIVDADLKFAANDIGSYGREGDAKTILEQKLKTTNLTSLLHKHFRKQIPTVLPHIIFVILGDEAFALHENLMKPCPVYSCIQLPSISCKAYN
jgi:hypothetical protein